MTGQNDRSGDAAARPAKRMPKDHAAVLASLAERTRSEGWCVPFSPIISDTGLPRTTVRRIIRLFARKGWAEFHKGLWTEDGDLAGAGYCITETGRTIAQATEPVEAGKTPAVQPTKESEHG